MRAFHPSPRVWERVLLTLTAICFISFILVYTHSPSTSPRIPDPSYGRLRDTPSPKHAIATFLDDSSGNEDFYFTAARLLTFQLLHANETRCRHPTPFIVLVTSGVTPHKRAQLQKDGATVIQVQDFPLPWWVRSTVKRWKNQFSKLRLLQMTEYDRILFIDADTLITRPLDAIFSDPAVCHPSPSLLSRSSQLRADEAQLPAQYVFAARSDNAFAGKRLHPVPPPSAESLSAGFWLAAPSLELFDHLSSIVAGPLRFRPQTMEQSLFNYAFRRDGAMPWRELDYRWSATYPNDADLAGNVATLHEKFWLKRGPEEMQRKWWNEKKRMEAFFDGM